MQETILSLKEEFSTGRQILWPGRQVLCQHLCADGSIIPKRRQVGRRRTRTCLPCQLTCEPLTGWHPQHVALNQSAAAMRGEGKVSEIGLRHPGGCRPHVGERSATSTSPIWEKMTVLQLHTVNTCQISSLSAERHLEAGRDSETWHQLSRPRMGTSDTKLCALLGCKDLGAAPI